MLREKVNQAFRDNGDAVSNDYPDDDICAIAVNLGHKDGSPECFARHCFAMEMSVDFLDEDLHPDFKKLLDEQIGLLVQNVNLIKSIYPGTIAIIDVNVKEELVNKDGTLYESNPERMVICDVKTFRQTPDQKPDAEVVANIEFFEAESAAERAQKEESV